MDAVAPDDQGGGGRGERGPPSPTRARKRSVETADLVPRDEQPGAGPKRRRFSAAPSADGADASEAEKLALGRLEAFCRTHARLQQAATSALHFTSDAYHGSYMLPEHTNGGGLRLFRRYDPLAGKDVCVWARCVYACGRRVDVEQLHVPGCDGWDKGGGALSFTSRHLARCGCPVEMRKSRYVWLIMPKTETVELEEYGTVVHGKEVVKENV